MFILSCKKLGAGIALLLLSVAVATANQQDGEQTPAAKIRGVLDQTFTMELSADDLKEFAQRLSDKTGVRFIVDTTSFSSPVSLDPGSSFDLKANRVPLSAALRRCLARHFLTYVVLEDVAVITSEQSAPGLQLWQLVSVRLDNVPLQQAFKDLQRITPFNLVIDPRISQHTQTLVSLELENTQLEAVVSLMAELAGLKTVSVDNAIFVTSEGRAEKMQNEQKANTAKSRFGGDFPDVAPPPCGPMGVRRPIGYGYYGPGGPACAPICPPTPGGGVGIPGPISSPPGPGPLCPTFPPVGVPAGPMPGAPPRVVPGPATTIPYGANLGTPPLNGTFAGAANLGAQPLYSMFPVR